MHDPYSIFEMCSAVRTNKLMKQNEEFETRNDVGHRQSKSRDASSAEKLSNP